MPWTYEEKFNTLTDGNLNTQDSWSGGTVFQVQTTTKYEGAKGIQASAASDNSIDRSVTGVSAGTIYIALRTSSLSVRGPSFRLYNGANLKMAVGFSGTDAVYLVQTTGWVSIMSANINQWYVFAIEFDDTAQPDKYRVKIHDGDSWSDWTSWSTVWEDNYTEIDKIQLYMETNNIAYIGYWDTITPTDPTVAPSPRHPAINFQDPAIV